jgi:hypothetical protein
MNGSRNAKLLRVYPAAPARGGVPASGDAIDVACSVHNVMPEHRRRFGESVVGGATFMVIVQGSVGLAAGRVVMQIDGETTQRLYSVVGARKVNGSQLCFLTPRISAAVKRQR